MYLIKDMQFRINFIMYIEMINCISLEMYNLHFYSILTIRHYIITVSVCVSSYILIFSLSIPDAWATLKYL